MMNENSLNPRQRLSVLNKSGRPLKDKAINFGPQPQSFISQLLQNLKERNVQNDQLLLQVPAESDTQTQELTSDEDSLLEESNCVTNEKSNIKQSRNTAQKEKLYTCNYMNCSYFTKISSNLTKHKRIHTSEKPYLCDTCSFQTKFVNSLKTHKRIHTDARPYMCMFCSYRCNSSSNLKKHCRHMHRSLPLNT